MAAKILKTIDEQIEILRSKGLVINDYDKSRIVKIPKEIFPVEENVILDA